MIQQISLYNQPTQAAEIESLRMRGKKTYFLSSYKAKQIVFFPAAATKK